MKFKKLFCTLLGISIYGTACLSAIATEYTNSNEQEGYQMDFEPSANIKNRFSWDEIMQMSDAERELLELSAPSVFFGSTRNAIDYSLNVPLYQQTKTYYCGPAAVLQLLYKERKYSTIQGSTAAEKQDTLARELGTTTSGTRTDKIVDVINSYTNRVRSWEMMHVDDYDSNDVLLLKYYMDSNFSNGHPTIYMVHTSSLGYYNGRESYHFVTGSGIKYENGLSSDNSGITMLIVDPHYDSNLAGKHEVPFDEMLSGMSETTGENFVY